MKPTRGRSGFSEGAAVALTSVVLIAGLAGLMGWRMLMQDAPPPPAVEETGLEAEAVQAAERVANGLRDELSGVKAQLRETEAKRVAAVAAAEEVGRARVRIRDLTKETEHLLARVAGLERKNRELEERLEGESTAPVATADPLPPEPLPATTRDGHSVSTKVLHNVRVFAVNKDLQYVVLDAGKQDGVRVGMRFHVMEGDQVVATLRAADVRDDLTGSTVENVVHGRFPQMSDRVILGKSSDK